VQASIVHGDEGESLEKPVTSAGLEAHFGFLAMLIALDNQTSNLATRRLLGWEPTHRGLLADFDTGDYFATTSQRN
jgi:hypothetical protein